MAGKNDLNIKIESEMVSFTGNLNIPKTIQTINKQIAELNKNNKALTKLKLDVKLNLSITELNKQIKTFQTLLNNAKTFKPLTMDVNFNLKNSTNKLKKELDGAEKTINGFGKTLKANANQIKSSTNVINNAVKGINVKNGLGKVGVETNKLSKEIDRVKNQLNQTFGKQKSGIFSFKEIKDGQGNLQGLVATLTKTNGIIQTMSYKINENGNKLIPFKQTTVNENEKNVNKAIASLKRLEAEMHRLENGSIKTDFFKEYNKLMKQANSGSLKTDSVKSLDDRIRKEQMLQGVMQKTDGLTAKNIRTLDGMQKAINRLGEGEGKNKLTKEFEKLSNQAKITKTDIANMNKNIGTEKELQQKIAKENALIEKQTQLIKDAQKARKQVINTNKDTDITPYTQIIKDTKSDLSEENINKQRKALELLNKENKEKENSELRSIKNRQKELSIIDRLRTLQRKSKDDSQSAYLINEAKHLASTANSAKEWLRVEEKISEIRKRNNQVQSNQETLNLQTQTQKRLIQLKNLGKLTEEQFQKSMNNLSGVASKGYINLNRYYETLGRRIERTQNEIKQVADRSKVLLDGTSTNGVSNTAKIQKAIDTGDIASLQKYISELYKADVDTIKVVQSTNKYGQAVDKLQIKMKGTGKTVAEYTAELNRHNLALTQTAQGSTYNANRNLGIFEQLKIAMARVPVWMVAMTGFYASINAVSSAVNKIIEIDTLMTNINRVSSDNINLDALFDGAVDMSAKLGNNLTDILNSLGEFSRTFGEFNERQLLAITQTATLMSNVSELTAQEATLSLVGTMNAFNITAEESIRIVDSLNEVDNNYAISTKQLAEGLSRSASTAKTFGSSMEDTIGHITAIGSVTMESGTVIGNSLKTIYSRITTMGGAEKALNDVGVAIYKIGENGEKVIKPVSDILSDLSTVWGDLTDAQQQHLTVTVAGRYQLNRFSALMNNFDVATASTTTALSSQGSAMRENAKYLESFEARLNKMKNSFSELALAVGDAFLADGMFVVIEGLKSIASSASFVFSKIGVLPPLFLALYGVLAKFGVIKMIGTSFTNLSNTLSRAKTVMEVTRASMLSTQASAVAMSTTSSGAFRTMAISARTAGATIVGAMDGIKFALKSLLASTGIGLAFVVLGGAIEFFTKKSREAKEEAEQLAEITGQMVNSFRTMGGSDGLNEMVDRFHELRGNSNKTNEEIAEMEQLSSQLAGSMDGMIDYIDAQGVAHLKNTEELKRQVKYAEDLAKAQSAIEVADFKKNSKDNKKEYQDLEKDIEKAEKALKKLEKNNGSIDSYGLVIDNTSAIAKANYDLIVMQDTLTQKIKDTTTMVKTASLAYLDQKGNLVLLSDSQRKVVENIVDMGEEYLRANNNSEQAQQNVLDTAVAYGDVLANTRKELEGLISQDLTPEETKKELDYIENKLETIAKSIPKDFLKLDKEGNLKLTQADFKRLIDELYKLDDIDGFEPIIDSLVKLGYPLEEAEILVKSLSKEMKNNELRAKSQADEIDGVTDSLGGYIETVIEAKDLTKEMFGYSGSDLSNIQNNLQALDLMIAKYGEVAKTSEEYKKVIQDIADILGTTPEFVEANQHRIEAIAEEMQKINFMEYYDYDTWEQFIDSQDIVGWVKEILKNAKGEIDAFTGEVNKDLSLTYLGEESVKTQEKITESVEKTINVSQDLIDKVAEVKDVIEPKDEGDFSQKFKENLESLGDKITVIKDETDNLKLKFSSTDGESNIVDELNKELESMGGNLDIVKDSADNFNLVFTKDGENTFIAKLNAGIEETKTKLGEANEKLNETTEKAEGLGETDATPKIDIDFNNLTEGTKEVYATMQDLDSAFDKLEENVQKLGAIETILNGLKDFINGIKDSISALFSDKTDFEGLKQTVLDTSKAVNELGDAINSIKNLASNIAISGFEDIQEEVDLAIHNIDRLKTSINNISISTDGVSVGGLPQVNALMNTLVIISDSITNLSKGFLDLKIKGIKDIESLSRSVVSNTNTMINKHNQQKIAIENLAKSARQAKIDINSLNSVANSASQSVKQYQVNANDVLDNLKPYLTADSLGNGIETNRSVNGHYNTSIQSISAQSFSTDGGTSSTSTSIGTSGIVRPSFNRAIGLNGQALLYATGVQSSLGRPSSSTSSSSTSSSNSSKNTASAIVKELDKLFTRDWYEITGDEFSANLDLFKAQLEGLKQGSEEYRNVLKKILKDENNYLYVISQQMKFLNNRNATISTRLNQLANTSKHTSAQREEYNELLKEFEENEKKIYSLRTEVTSATIELRATAQSVMQDVVDEILNAFEYTLAGITRRISNIDFKLQVLEITDSDNIAEKMNLMADKVREMAMQQDNYKNAMKELEGKLFEATQKYGKDSNIVKKMTEELEGLQDAWQDTYLEILKTEQEIKQTRTGLADDIVSQMKKRNEQMRDNEIKALNESLKATQKAYKEKMDMYDEEINKIKELYDAKIRSLDDEASEDDYQEQLAEKNGQLAELQNQAFLLAGDDSLEGKKRYKEKQKEIEELQKEIDRFVLERQRELTKQQLQDQRDYEVEKVEMSKESAEKELADKEEANEKEIDLITNKYDSIINDEQKWSNIRAELIKGNFALLNEELGAMGINIEQHTSGIFDVLSENFSTYTQEVKDFVTSINSMIGNLNDTSGLNTGNLGNSSPEGIVDITNTLRNQDIPFIIQKSKNGIKMDISTPEKDYLYDLIKNSDISESFMQHIWNKALSNTPLDVPTPEKMMFYNLFKDIIKRNKMKSFDTGGYTGSWGSDGKLAMLHEKELVLNKGQTEDILNVVKLMNKMNMAVPKINRNSTIPTNTSNVTNGDNIEINVNIDSFGGSKSEVNNLGKDIANILKKTGRK